MKTQFKYCSDKNAYANLRTIAGFSVLYTACQKGHTAIVKRLLKSGDKVTLCDIYGLNPLHEACKS